MADDNALTPREAAALRQNAHIEDDYARGLAEFKRHARELHAARERLKTTCVQYGLNLDEL